MSTWPTTGSFPQTPVTLGYALAPENTILRTAFGTGYPNVRARYVSASKFVDCQYFLTNTQKATLDQFYTDMAGSLSFDWPDPNAGTVVARFADQIVYYQKPGTTWMASVRLELLPTEVTDQHGDPLSAYDQSAYVLLNGRATGQTISGDTLTTGVLNLRGNYADLTTGSVKVLTTVDATSAASGAFTVAGGAGVAKNLFVGSALTSAIVYGSSASGGDLVLKSTSHGTTKGKIYFGTNSVYDEVNDRFGIGITSPVYSLDIHRNGTGQYTDIGFANTDSTASLAIGIGGSNVGAAYVRNNAYVINNSASDLIFGTSSTERMRITSTGNVGIGTSIPGSLLTVSKAQISNIEGGAALDSTMLLRQNTDAGYASALEFGFGSNLANYLGARIVGSIVTDGGADLLLQTGSAYNGTYTTKLAILRDGNVGIGTTTPDSLLHIKSTSSFANINIMGGQVGDVGWLLMSGYPAAGDFTIRESSVANYLTIKKTTGNVGIGTTTPTTARLVVKGTTNDGSAPLLLDLLDSDVVSQAKVDSNGKLTTKSAEIGDGTNYTAFDTTGHQTMVGAAKPWTDVRVEPTARGGANAPSFEQWFDELGLGTAGDTRGVYLYSFTDEVEAQEKELHFTIQMPHEWDGLDIHLHVHWISATTASAPAAVRWGLEYTFAEPSAVFGSTVTAYASAPESGDTGMTAAKHQITEFSPITPTASQNGLSSILIGRLFRNSSNAADTYTGKAGLLYIDAHYQLNSLGSTDEYVK